MAMHVSLRLKLAHRQEGFHAQNSHIAHQADYPLAFTWSETASPADGGTLDTWNKCRGTKVHVSLHSLLSAVRAS
jgi:hypothetical protein